MPFVPDSQPSRGFRADPIVQPKPNLLQRAGQFFKDQVQGKRTQHNLPGAIFDETVGARGLGGIAQAPGRVLGQFGLVKEQKATTDQRAALEEATAKLVQAIRNTPDPQRRAMLESQLAANRQALGIAGNASAELNKHQFTPRDAIADTLRAATTAATGSGSVAKTVGLKGASVLPKPAATAVAKVLTAGKGVVPRAVEQAGLAAGYQAATNVENQNPVTKDLGKAAGFGAALPVIGTAASKAKDVLSKGSDRYAGRVINSLIKPLQKDFSYGKNPGRGVAAEGITFNNLDEGIEKISARKAEIGQQIRAYIRYATDNKDIRFDATDVFTPITEALQKARKAPRTNKAVLERLDEVVQDLLEVTEKDGQRVAGRKIENMTADELFQLKQDIAELTRFTGNSSDDVIVNKALKQVYGKIKEKLNKAIPELEPSNERYADLASAEVAARYRDKIEQRANLVTLGGKVSAIGGAVLTVIASGGGALPAVLAGAGVYGLEKALGTPRVKTRVAKWLSTATPAQKQALYEKIPGLKNAIERVFGY